MNTISGLPTITTIRPDAVAPVSQGATTGKVALSQLVKVIPEATLLAAGLMSAEDKATLDSVAEDVTTLVNAPTIATVASASQITVPDDANVVVITGSTDINSILGGVDFRNYLFYRFEAGTIQVLGRALSTATPLLLLKTP
jgi:hypothetical protein